MKKKVVSCVVIFIIFLFSHTAIANFKRTKVAVLDFQVQGEQLDTQDMGKIVAEWLITAMVKDGRFDIIERRLLEKILQEQQVGSSGIVDPESAVRLGKVLGVKTVITGSVMKIGRTVEVNARLISVESGSIVAAENVKADTVTKLDVLVSQIAEKIVRAFPLEGYVVERDGDRVTIDIGRIAGAKVGMRFVVYKEGKEIRHPKTGEVLEIATIEIGEIEINDVKEKTSTGIITFENAPNAVSYGNMVKTTVEPKPEVVPEKPKVEVAPEKPKIEVVPEKPKEIPQKRYKPAPSEEDKEQTRFPEIMD